MSANIRAHRALLQCQLSAHIVPDKSGQALVSHKFSPTHVGALCEREDSPTQHPIMQGKPRAPTTNPST